MTTETGKPGEIYKDKSPRENLEEAAEEMQKIQENLPEIIKGLRRQADPDSKAGPARKIDKTDRDDKKKLHIILGGAKNIQQELDKAGVKLPTQEEPSDTKKVRSLEANPVLIGWPGRIDSGKNYDKMIADAGNSADDETSGKSD